MPKQATRSKPRDAATESIETITESKLSRVEMIAREALDILGTAAPEDLRRSAADERAEHEAMLAEAEARRSELEQELRKTGERATELERSLRAAERLAEERLAEAEEVWELARRHADETAAATSRIEALENDLTLTRVTADSRARAHDEVMAELKQAGEALKAAKAAEAELRAELASVTETRDAAVAALESLREERDGLAEQIDDLRSAHARALQSVEADLAHATTAAAAEQAKSTAISDELAEARQALETMSADLDEASVRIETIQTDLDIARNEIAQRSAAQRDAEERFQRAREAHAELETELDEARQHAEACDQARSELRQSRQEMAELTAKLADRDRTIAELSNGSPATHEPKPSPAISTGEADSALDDLRAALEARSTELVFTREQLDRADARATRYRERAERAKQDLDKAKSIVRRARRRAGKRTESFASTITAMTAYRDRCARLERECLTLQETARMRLIWAAAAGGLALIGILSAAVF